MQKGAPCAGHAGATRRQARMAGTRAFFFRHGHARGGGLRHGAKEPAGKKTARLGRRPPGRPAMGCTDMLGGRRATTGLEEGTATCSSSEHTGVGMGFPLVSRGPPARRESGRGPSLVGAARAAEPRGDPPAALAQGAEVPGRSFMPCFLETTTFSGAPSTILPSSSSLHFWPRGWPGPPLRPSGSSRGRQATPIENIFPSVMHRVFGRPK
ncbi:unnamed protein product [Prorocentrum cordatum]|uniref:Uncharacterized protein n=3 Tax=Prorocentrum cordatum TaxID=2364126 RepID=A0ABN9VLC4_9DINO|nr:unnamed protein product [Polarella glacialis]